MAAGFGVPGCPGQGNWDAQHKLSFCLQWEQLHVQQTWQGVKAVPWHRQAGDVGCRVSQSTPGAAASPSLPRISCSGLL